MPRPFSNALLTITCFALLATCASQLPRAIVAEIAFEDQLRQARLEADQQRCIKQGFVQVGDASCTPFVQYIIASANAAEAELAQEAQ